MPVPPLLPLCASRAAPGAGNRSTPCRWTRCGLSVFTALDLLRFPAPAAWGTGLRPPLQHRHSGECLLRDDDLRSVGNCLAAPPDPHLPAGAGVHSGARAGRPGPTCPLRCRWTLLPYFLRRTAARLRLEIALREQSALIAPTAARQCMPRKALSLKLYAFVLRSLP